MKINSYLLIALLLVVSIVLIIFIPQWQEENYRNTINAEDIAKLEPKDRVQLQKDLALVENSFRTTLAQIIGGALLLLSLYLTYQNVKNAQENTKIANENTKIANENLRLVEEGKLTDRFSKAVELLGNKKLEIRLGGIYALERIACDSQKDHWTVMEFLTAFIRANTLDATVAAKLNANSTNEKSKVKKDKLGEDIQAIMAVIARRKWAETESPRELYLPRVTVAGANLFQANLHRAFLQGADLSNTFLINSDLREASLWGINLSNCYLSKAKLSGADLRESNLKGARLDRADLSRADLSNADLSGAELNMTRFESAILTNANLTGVRNISLVQILGAQKYDNVKLSPELEAELREYLLTNDKQK